MAKGETQHYVFVFDGQLSSSSGGHALFSRPRHHRADGRQSRASPSRTPPLASLWDAWLTRVSDWNNTKQPALGEQVGVTH